MAATKAKLKSEKLPMKHALTMCFALLISSSVFAQSTGNETSLGARVFRACAACHSLEKDRNMTGPSLAGIWNRKARYASQFPPLLGRHETLRHNLGPTKSRWLSEKSVRVYARQSHDVSRSTRRKSSFECNRVLEICGRNPEPPKSGGAVATGNGFDARRYGWDARSHGPQTENS